MINDIVTIVWKEWKEVFMRRSGARGGWFNVIIIVALVGIFMPLQFGSAWLTNPLFPLMWSWIPIFLSINLIADAFAGERERHTLETLLASRLSDRAILLGKISAAVFYAWSINTAGLLLGALTRNLASPGEGLRFYTGWTFPAGLLLSLLLALLMSTVGVLVSLNAPTARSAYQRLSIVVMAVWLLPTIGLQFLPEALRAQLFRSVSGLSLGPVLLAGLAFLLAVDAALLLVAMARFKRSRLILE